MTRIALAASTELSVMAGMDIAHAGGNAVDAAIAAALVASTTEPGICSLGGGAHILIWPSAAEAASIDGYVAVPGLGTKTGKPAPNPKKVHMEYGGGVTTLIGHDSVATPGTPAAFGSACKQFGKLPLAEVFKPAIDIARHGFPLSATAHYYLSYVHELIFSLSVDGYRALHNEQNELHEVGTTIVIPGLAESLEHMARYGVESFYQGAIADLILADMKQHRGLLTEQDLSQYQAIRRIPLKTKINDWSLACPPPPAIGGTCLTAMLKQFLSSKGSRHERIVEAQLAVMRARREKLDLSAHLEADLCTFLAEQPWQQRGSASTIHVSAVDSDGTSCAVTVSAGYSSGVMPTGSGIWLNNCLGELELSRRGYLSGKAGERMTSNMSPCVARNSCGDSLAIGSPGADRITTALQQALILFAEEKLEISEAVAQARAHVEINDSGNESIAYETGFADKLAFNIETRCFDTPSMYFGGVAATLCRQQGLFELTADPRRTGLALTSID